ncbi:Glutamate-1-semialdehyde 2,1-aminomutase [Wickerhamomyces ciferrii]|uniref:Glutamate-1-semialdehyde 2,1-aminomutase n=1 Tax=Wickerhamomyces ciferrii (strain ATCC 14091 / BCRC 22168 / CBS 111 / JCM 3599 / NBRC 0793 / NRRL Y-1031 F-60-10) TaxID=1206466 RepID=K0KZG5_WICCF|nr:Glutamate-1-semialdehyde 2,1-aminomutase [Wickerhamomyces ciferrii]CCH46729.1 Glutamate-1-semialdehyde 2,1-aminomutase [Wickerhamomyces ciferrii]
MSSIEDKLEFDRKHIWHPYTSLTKPLTCHHVDSADGVHINLSSGEKCVDGMSSWWCAIHGYSNSELNKAALEQIGKMSHVMFGGLTHDPAIKLVEKLLKLVDDKLDCCFLADSGSVSVEVSLKMAIQYCHANGQPQKDRFLTISNGYHGDTFGAMSVCDPINSMHTLYSGYMSDKHIFARTPQCKFNEEWDPKDVVDFEQKLISNHKNIAAVIIEPILQGAGGMRMYHPMYLKRVRQLCDEYGILLILDEIATGFGRTGKLFAYEHSDIVPDILLVGKALTGGYMTLAALTCQRFVAEMIGNDPKTGGSMMHGPTFMGNPLACAVAIKSLELIETGEWKKQCKFIESILGTELMRLENCSIVKDIRILGAVGVVELNLPVDMGWFQKLFVTKHNVWIRPFNRLVYIMPPYIIKEKELLQLTNAVVDVVQCFSQKV